MVMCQNIHVSSDLNKNEKTADMSGISTCKIFRLHNIFQKQTTADIFRMQNIL